MSETVNRFNITFKRGAYYVDIPRYSGGEVVAADVADALIKALEPFAQLADICDHFDHKDERRICRVTIDGEAHDGPTAGDCRKARDAIRAALPPQRPAGITETADK